mmetsp:Transcript_56333/g.163395  ORF Transcript_56333/g.163395 Transcript_56333/m.163395 type:complete len:368 (+) Transcript_56333:270-1373(+)
MERALAPLENLLENRALFLPTSSAPPTSPLERKNERPLEKQLALRMLIARASSSPLSDSPSSSSICTPMPLMMLRRIFRSSIPPMCSSLRSIETWSISKVALTSSRKFWASLSSWWTMDFSMHVVVFGSEFFSLNMTSTNSLGSISPLPFESIIKNKRRKSRLSRSRTRSQCRNSGTRPTAACNSSSDSAPLPSTSILLNNLPKTHFSCLSCCSKSVALVVTSFSRASAKVSTITATTRLSTPQTKDMSAPTKTRELHGYASMIGTASLPHESPATTVWKNVMFAMNTEENDRRQRSQSGQAPRSYNSWTKGLMSSTASTAQAVMMNRRRKKDQNKVFTHPLIIWINRRSSLRVENPCIMWSSRKSL